MRRSTLLSPAVVPAVIVPLAILAALGTFSTASHAQQPRPVTPRGPLDAQEQNNIAVFRRVSPSVVHITTLSQQRDFFSRNVTEVPSGTGSGFFWDEQGHIVTNFHVIRGASAAKVTLSDQSSFDARLVGVDPDRDLAVLRITAPRERLLPVPMGSSRELLVGQTVYAIGNPFGLDQTLTRGIVSALNREIESLTQRTIRNAIQTDAAINPGNSGGPLLDSAGRLIGVNTSIFSPSGGSNGIGFAIPADEVNRVVPQLIQHGRVIRPALGLTAGTEQLRQVLRLPKGVVLIGLQAGGAAQRAGLKPFMRGRDGRIVGGDVITAVNGTPVSDLDTLLNELEERQIGEKVTLTVWNGGKTRQVQAQLTSD